MRQEISAPASEARSQQSYVSAAADRSAWRWWRRRWEAAAPEGVTAPASPSATAAVGSQRFAALGTTKQRNCSCHRHRRHRHHRHRSRRHRYRRCPHRRRRNTPVKPRTGVNLWVHFALAEKTKRARGRELAARQEIDILRSSQNACWQNPLPGLLNHSTGRCLRGETPPPKKGRGNERRLVPVEESASSGGERHTGATGGAAPRGSEEGTE